MPSGQLSANGLGLPFNLQEECSSGGTLNHIAKHLYWEAFTGYVLNCSYSAVMFRDFGKHLHQSRTEGKDGFDMQISVAAGIKKYGEL